MSFKNFPFLIYIPRRAGIVKKIRLFYVAEVKKVDLIILGAGGFGTLKGLLPGSASQKAFQHATCPILIVR